jgi:2-polyprenyl-6-methoxyphenol hydroxylase-like FAD-dependent oxidoreductase
VNPRIVIAGAGIAGLTAALALHAKGFKQVRVIERAHVIRPLGSGINVLPHAVRELDALGLLDTLAPHCVLTGELLYMNHLGDCIWREERGVAAGYRWPQLSIQRGLLQEQLLQAVIDAFGADAVRTGIDVTGVRSGDGGALLDCTDRGDGDQFQLEADLVVGADGIRSAVRRVLNPLEGPPPANGLVVFRGMVWGASFLSGRSMIIAGNGLRKIVLYPMAVDPVNGKVLLNWAAAMPEDAGAGFTRGDWNQPVPASSFAHAFAGWNVAGVKPDELMLASPDTFVYPMVDRASLASWSRDDNVVLIGDAAHAMYPIGSNGATQSIIDGCALAHHLAAEGSVAAGVAAYEADRLPRMTELQAANRRQGPEVVIDLACQRAPDGFKERSEVFGEGELEEIAANYRRVSSMELARVNRPSPYHGSTDEQVNVRRKLYA